MFYFIRGFVTVSDIDEVVHVGACCCRCTWQSAFFLSQIGAIAFGFLVNFFGLVAIIIANIAVLPKLSSAYNCASHTVHFCRKKVFLCLLWCAGRVQHCWSRGQCFTLCTCLVRLSVVSYLTFWSYSIYLSLILASVVRSGVLEYDMPIN